MCPKCHDCSAPMIPWLTWPKSESQTLGCKRWGGSRCYFMLSTAKRGLLRVSTKDFDNMYGMKDANPGSGASTAASTNGTNPAAPAGSAARAAPTAAPFGVASGSSAPVAASTGYQPSIVGQTRKRSEGSDGVIVLSGSESDSVSDVDSDELMGSGMFPGATISTGTSAPSTSPSVPLPPVGPGRSDNPAAPAGATPARPHVRRRFSTPPPTGRGGGGNDGGGNGGGSGELGGFASYLKKWRAERV